MVDVLVRIWAGPGGILVSTWAELGGMLVKAKPICRLDCYNKET